MGKFHLVEVRPTFIHGHLPYHRIPGDLRDPKSLDRALKGVDGVFYIAPVFQKDEAQLGENIVAATIAAGVRRFVFSSVIHPVLSALTNHAANSPVEEAVLNSNLEYTFLHPTLFFQNSSRSNPASGRTGVSSIISLFP